MRSAFQSIASSSLALFGLVMATLAFGYGAAMRQLRELEVFRHFSRWLWTAGTCCCVYYSYCFLVSTHQIYGSYSRSFFEAMLILATVALAAGHVTETLFLYRMCRLDMSAMRWIISSQTTLASLTFAAFLFLNWRVLFLASRVQEKNLFIALIFTIILISFRAIFLVGFSFNSVLMLQERRLKNQSGSDVGRDRSGAGEVTYVSHQD